MIESPEIIQQKRNSLQSVGANPVQRKRMSVAKLRRAVGRLKTEDFDLQKKLNGQNCVDRFNILLSNFQNKIYILLEDPTSSPSAMLLQYLILFCIFLSSADIIADSVIDQSTTYGQLQSIVEVFLFSVFFSEYLLRLLSSTAFNRKISAFITSPMNVIDFFAILPFIVEQAFQTTTFKQFRIMRAVRFLRVFRIFKVSRYVKGINLLVDTMNHSIHDILMLICLFIVMVLTFSTMIFHWEKGSDWNSCGVDQRAIRSMLDAFWWAITTMTTVGYGDKIPFTIEGKILTCVAALLGTTCISLPVAILGHNFSECLTVQQEQIQMEQLKKENISHHGSVEDNLLYGETNDEKDHQELLFMEHRLHQIFENNQRLQELTNQSQTLVDEVTDQLKTLYQVLSKHLDLHLEQKLKSEKADKKVMIMEKKISERKQLDVHQIINSLRQSSRAQERKKSQIQSQQPPMPSEKSITHFSTIRDKLRGSKLMKLTTEVTPQISVNHPLQGSKRFTSKTQHSNNFLIEPQWESNRDNKVLEQRVSKTEKSFVTISVKHSSSSFGDLSCLDSFRELSIEERIGQLNQTDHRIRYKQEVESQPKISATARILRYSENDMNTSRSHL